MGCLDPSALNFNCSSSDLDSCGEGGEASLGPPVVLHEGGICVYPPYARIISLSLGGFALILALLLACRWYCAHRSAKLDVARACVCLTRGLERLGCCLLHTRVRKKVTTATDSPDNRTRVSSRLALRRRFAWDSSPPASPARRSLGAGSDYSAEAVGGASARRSHLPFSGAARGEFTSAALSSGALSAGGNSAGTVGVRAHVSHLRAIERLRREKRRLEAILVESAVAAAGVESGAGAAG
jgi:hypothetical protein